MEYKIKTINKHTYMVELFDSQGKNIQGHYIAYTYEEAMQLGHNKLSQLRGDLMKKQKSLEVVSQPVKGDKDVQEFKKRLAQAKKRKEIIEAKKPLKSKIVIDNNQVQVTKKDLPKLKLRDINDNKVIEEFRYKLSRKSTLKVGSFVRHNKKLYEIVG